MFELSLAIGIIGSLILGTALVAILSMHNKWK